MRWCDVQNCHLAVSWLPKLEQLLEKAQGSTEQHRDYRLWLTSMPSPKFPVPILQNGIKMTQEPPRGLKANLTRTFNDVSEAEYEVRWHGVSGRVSCRLVSSRVVSCRVASLRVDARLSCVQGCTKPRAFKKLLFGLAFYHALILERRKFGAIGWNIPYEWMNSDLKTGIMQLKMYLEEQPNVPYVTLNSVVGDITYGGRCVPRCAALLPRCHRGYGATADVINVVVGGTAWRVAAAQRMRGTSGRTCRSWRSTSAPPSWTMRTASLSPACISHRQVCLRAAQRSAGLRCLW